MPEVVRHRVHTPGRVQDQRVAQRAVHHEAIEEGIEPPHAAETRDDETPEEVPARIEAVVEAHHLQRETHTERG